MKILKLHFLKKNKIVNQNKKNNNKNGEWYTETLQNMKEKLQFLGELCHLTSDPKIVNEKNKIRKGYRKEIEHAKKSYIASTK